MSGMTGGNSRVRAGRCAPFALVGAVSVRPDARGVSAATPKAMTRAESDP